jgi:maleate isomerase
MMAIRRRIGLIVPAANNTCEADFALAVPRNATVHADRLWGAVHVDENDETVDRMNAGVEKAARHLAAARVEIIAYGFATGSFYKGPAGAADLVRRIRDEAKVPVVLTSQAMVEALRQVRAERVSVLSPYPRWNNERLGMYLEAVGFTVLNVEGEPRAAAGGFPVMSDQEPEAIASFCADACDPKADALLISCTMWRGYQPSRPERKQSGSGAS